MTYSKGVCIWFTGRSGAGKSTITKALLPLLYENGRTVSVLDVVPYLKKQRCERTSEGKLLRKAFVASEIVKHGGVVICVTVSARSETREAAREIVGAENFVEVLVDVPAEIARARKAKRTRKPSRAKRARHAFRRYSGKIPFRQDRGYDSSVSPDLTIDTMHHSAEEGAKAIYQLLHDRGYLVSVNGRQGTSSNTEDLESRSMAGEMNSGSDASEIHPDVILGNGQ